MRPNEPFHASDVFEALHAAGLNRVTPFTAPPFRITGSNESVGNVVDETVWDGPTALRPRPVTDIDLEVVSDDPDDTELGTGARFVGINTVTEAGAIVPQNVAMNGTTPVPLPTPVFRVQPSGTIQVGAGGRNAGVISIRAVSDQTVFDQIGVNPGGTGYGVTHSAAFFVPAGFVALLKTTFFGLDDDVRAVVVQRVPPPLGLPDPVGIRQFAIPLRNQGESESVLCFPQFTDFEIQGRSSTGNSEVSIAMRIWLIDSRSGRCPS